MERKTRLRLASFLFAAAVAVVAVLWTMGTELCRPVPRRIGPPPPELHAIDVRFGTLAGWYVPAAPGAPCVVLMHGVRADRRSMTARASMLREAGYASLLFDFQAHGESPGEHITFGYLESGNARAAVALLRDEYHCSRIGAIGTSMGGAAALLGDEPLKVDALVLESVYPTIDEAVADRLQIRLGGAGAWLAPLLMAQLRPRLGFGPEVLRPVDRIGLVREPVFVLSGTADRHTHIEEARRLYAAAPEPKQLWEVPGAGHVDLYRYAPEEYRGRVLDFLGTYLQQGGPPRH